MAGTVKRVAGDLAAAPRAVQLVDRGRSAAERLRRAPDDPARGVAEPGVLVEDGLEDEVVHEQAAERGLVTDGEAVGPISATPASRARRSESVAMLTRSSYRRADTSVNASSGATIRPRTAASRYQSRPPGHRPRRGARRPAVHQRTALSPTT